VNNKNRSCEICGYNINVELHHPHGREKTALLAADDEYIRITEGDATTRKNRGEEIYQGFVYLYPRAVVELCPNCHKLFTVQKKSLTYVVNITKEHYRIRGFDVKIPFGKHIKETDSGYEFLFDENEMVPNLFMKKGGTPPNTIMYFTIFNSREDMFQDFLEHPVVI
jgi:hypothetical protein